MAIEYPPLIPDLLTRFGINPLDFTSYTDLLRELQALFNAIGANPAGAGGTVDGRLDAIEIAIAAPAKTVTTADSTAIANTTTETAFSNGKLTVAANSAVIGRTFRVVAGGKLSSVSSAPGTLTFNLRWGGVNTDPLLVACGPTGTLPVSLANDGWFLQALLTVRTIGSSGSAKGTGALVLANSTTDQSAVAVNSLAALATINTTLAKDLTLFAKWSVANAANTITLENFLVEQVN